MIPFCFSYSSEYLCTQVLKRHSRVGRIDLAESRLDNVVSQPLDQSVSFVCPKVVLMLFHETGNEGEG